MAYVCEFNFSVTDINVSAGCLIKTLKPNAVLSVLPSSKTNRQNINQNIDLLESITLFLNL